MHIDYIEIKNLRSFKEVKLLLSKGINILVGANNAGKSSIIKAAYHLNKHTYHIRASDIRKTEEFCGVFIKISGIKTFKEKKLFTNKNFRLPEGESQIVFRKIHSKEYSNQDLSYYFDPDLLLSRDINWSIQLTDSTGLVEFAGFPNNEDEGNFIYPFLSKRKNEVYRGNTGYNETFAVTDTFRNLLGKIQKISNPTHLRHSEFNEYCDKILGFRVGVVPNDEDKNSQENRIGVYATDTATIPLESMGEGVANIIGLLAYLLSEDNKLYLIEELENDIHPRALKILLELILKKSQNNQFIISTHSNIVLKYLGTDSSLFYIHWNANDPNNESARIPISEVEVIENTPAKRLKILEELGYDLFDFDLYSAYLIFEESSAERIIRDIIIPLFIPRLKEAFRTLAAQGTSDLLPKFNDLHRTFLYLHANPIYKEKVWVFADGDDAGLVAIKDLTQVFPSWPSKHFINFQKSSFESYYPLKFKKKVAEVLNIQDKRKKREAKKDLLDEVIGWTYSNTEDAKKEFAESAKEVIEVLKSIESQFQAIR